MKTNIAVDIRELEELVEHLEQVEVPDALSWQRFTPEKTRSGEKCHQLSYQYQTSRGLRLKVYFQKNQSVSRLFKTVKYKLTMLVEDKVLHPTVGDIKYGIIRAQLTKIFRERFVPIAEQNSGSHRRYNR